MCVFIVCLFFCCARLSADAASVRGLVGDALAQLIQDLSSVEKVMHVYRDKCAGPERMGIKQGLIARAGFGVSCFLLFVCMQPAFTLELGLLRREQLHSLKFSG
ncbi:putative Type I protein exporter [Helianthus annuus]|nr:putative Type I protein exporter [Helianthus annuus]